MTLQDSLANNGFNVFHEEWPRIEQKHFVVHENDNGVKPLKSPGQRVFHVEGMAQDMASLVT